MAFISLGKVDKNIFIIIAGCVFSFLNRLLNQYKETLLFDYVILFLICIALSRFLTIILFIIIKIRNKQDKNTNFKVIINKASQPSRDENRKEEKFDKGKWGLIILTSLLLFIELFTYIFELDIKTNSLYWYILLSSIFYFLFFKVKLYRHHYLSIILILLIGLIIDLGTGNLQNEIVNNTFHLLMKYLKEILFALYNVLAKYIMEKKYISVYEFSFYIGLNLLILLSIVLTFDYYCFRMSYYDEYFNKFNITELFVILGVILTQFGINITTLFTVKNNSPCHVFIIFVFGHLAYYINFDNFSILIIICLIIILFLALIFNEIIEINLCGMSDNTKKNIAIRAGKENLNNENIEEKIDEGEYLIELYEEENSCKSD
jgi:drug/metabolite transporter (DMT)-like permease